MVSSIGSYVASFLGAGEIKASPGLRDQLHASMHAIHAEAQSNVFLQNLISGKMSCSKAYVVYLCNLFWLHQALERAQEKIVEKVGSSSFVFPFLYRSEKLLRDIHLWSFPNPTSIYFADKEEKSGEFIENIKRFVQPSVFEFIGRLEVSTAEDPLIAVGAMYAFYGTVMSGGQFVKEGVKKAFLTRLEEAREEFSEGVSCDSALKAKLLASPGAEESYIEESVSFFSIPEVNITDFKPHWHEALDKVALYFKGEARVLFEKKTVELCHESMRVVLTSIESFHEMLRKGEI